MAILIPGKNIREVRVRSEGTRVSLIAAGREIFSLPWDAALDLAKAIYTQAKRSEEQAKARDIISDQALLTRIGATWGLTNRRDMLKEATKEAVHNRFLRPAIPPAMAKGIASQEVFGTPT